MATTTPVLIQDEQNFSTQTAGRNFACTTDRAIGSCTFASWGSRHATNETRSPVKQPASDCRRRWLMLFVLLSVSRWALAIDPPDVNITTANGGIVRVAFQSAQETTGFNVYKDTDYLLTVPFVPESGVFELDVGWGSYCIVAYVKSAQGTRYSRCSRSVVAGQAATAPEPGLSADPGTEVAPDAAPAQSNATNLLEPQNLIAEVYSKTAAELFWDPLSPGQTAIEHRIYHDGKMLGSTNGRSFFLNRLRTGERYIFTVTRVAPSGIESDGAEVEVQMRGSIANAAANPARILQLSLGDFAPLLQEGGGDLVVPLRVTAGNQAQLDGNDEPVVLSLQTAFDDSLNQLQYRFEPATLSAGQTSSQLFISLPVAMAPVLPRNLELRISATQSGATVQQTVLLVIAPVDAPDVYLLAGQSNMIGSSNAGVKDAIAGGLDETHPRIRQLNVVQNDRQIFNRDSAFTSARVNLASPMFVVAEDPLHHPRVRWRDDKGGTRIGLGLSFAKALLPHTSQDILLVPAAWSGSGFCAAPGDPGWNAADSVDPALGGTLLLDRALTRLNIALRESGGVFRGILWHQGEADSNNLVCASLYRRNLQQLVEKIRAQAVVDRRGASARGPQAPIPFVAGTMSKAGEFAHFGVVKDRVDTTHRLIAQLVPWSGFVNSDDLVPPAYSCGSNSCVHFGAAALREMGVRYAKALQEIVHP